MKFTGAAQTIVKRPAGTPVASTRSAGDLQREEITRIAARFVKKIPGRRGHPQCIVDLMYADYKRLNSLSKVGKLHGRTRQAVFDLFKSHGLKMNPRHFLSVRIHDGIKYTKSGKGGFWRATDGPEPRRLLQQAVWIEANGPIPAGYCVGFKDGNKDNCALKNLVCLSAADLTRMYWRRNFPERVNWTAEDWRRHRNAIAKRSYKGRSKKHIRAGLTCEGKVRRQWPPGQERKEWDFVYVAPAACTAATIVREDRDKKVIRRHVGRFSPKGAIGDLFREIHAEVDRQIVRSTEFRERNRLNEGRAA